MVKGEQIAGLLVAVTIAAVLFSPVATVVSDNTGEQTVTNETVTASHGDWVELNGYAIQEDSETVYWHNSTSDQWEEATSPDDYEMDYPPGAIRTNSSGTIPDGDEIRVSYTYEATSGTTSTVLGMVPMFVALLILVTLAVKVEDGL